MTLELHNLQSYPRARHKTKRVGRGNASGAGTYSGKGQKGQRARSGGRKRLIQRGVKHFIMRLPKTRGFYRLPAQTAVVTVGQLQNLPTNSMVTAMSLTKLGMIKSDTVKVIGFANLSRPLQLKVQAITPGARQAVEAAGGSVEIVIGEKLKKKKAK